jgi:hypothetical protein
MVQSMAFFSPCGKHTGKSQPVGHKNVAGKAGFRGLLLKFNADGEAIFEAAHFVTRGCGG